MNVFTAVNARLSRWAMYIACACLAGLLAVVVYGVVLRYVFNDAPPYVEQVALLLVISVAMFGAAAGVRDAGHIGLDSLVKKLPPPVQRVVAVVVEVLILAFALLLLAGSVLMILSTRHDTIPTLGISEAFRYAAPVLASLLIALFSVTHLLALFGGKTQGPAWN